ncbi:hypothetical protein HF995_07315 [Sanguibacter hominis ATCC BAA-789]|uniref:Uncharacterized protein n=1 Tax=Sanguibacter hominis ATCC BAA-789 TaxID=1312740 RepID=A0A9X5FBF2_9MICO|nr:hypothetical protein [Sanguibacter hominis]NKX93084.1 hypothetical protein [Sanguibacter hominis ATCC BAA-789]
MNPEPSLPRAVDATPLPGAVQSPALPWWVVPAAALAGLVTTGLPLALVLRPREVVYLPDDARPVEPGLFDLIAVPTLWLLVLVIALAALVFGTLVRTMLNRSLRRGAPLSPWRLGAVSSLAWLVVLPVMGGGFTLVVVVFTAGIAALVLGGAIVAFCLPGSFLAAAIVARLATPDRTAG